MTAFSGSRSLFRHRQGWMRWSGRWIFSSSLISLRFTLPTQFAGDMHARLQQRRLTLLQVWSEEDFIRLQENLIGHLIMKRRLKQSPTLFIATTDSEQEMVAVCNLTGEVILEEPGRNKREILSPSVRTFLDDIQPVIGPME